MATASNTTLEIKTETPQERRIRRLQVLIAEYEEEAGRAYNQFLDAPQGSEARSAFHKKWIFATASYNRLQGMLGEERA